MNFHKIRTVLLSALVSVCSLGTVQAQTVSVNNTNCPGATVTLGAGTIAINTAGCGGTVVTPTAPTITSGAPPATGNMGAPYSHNFAASGSTPITWSVTTGALPTGLTLSSGGVISGSPTATGAFTFQVTASNGTAPAAVSTTYTVTIANLPVITSTAPSNATAGVPYSHTFIASQTTPAIAWTVSTGALPSWVTLNSSTGVLSGTPAPADVGTATFSISATNTNGVGTQNVTLSVITLTAPTITGSTPPAGTANSTYTPFTFTASGTAPITWTVASGTLPPGLTLATTGVLSGTPTTAGTYMFAVQAANGTLPNATSTTYSLVINPPVVLTGAVTVDIAGNVIPRPISRAAKAIVAQHPGLNGGSTIGGDPDPSWHGWAPDPARCSGTPAITRYWYHNIDILDYGRQNALDYLDFAPNQAVTFAFVPGTPAANNSQVGRVFITTGPNATPASTFVSISTEPCDFNTAKIVAADPCYKTGASENGMTFQITTNPTSPVCKLTPGTQYYLNLRFQDARPAPTGAPTIDACAVTLPPGYPTCGALLQIFTY